MFSKKNELIPCPGCHQNVIPHTVKSGQFHTKFCPKCGRIIPTDKVEASSSQG